jgi:hypothetical protein
MDIDLEFEIKHHAAKILQLGEKQGSTARQ